VNGKRRQMIYAPEINPNTFLFFFSKGDSGNSWSIRDYSVQNRLSGPCYASEFDFSVDGLWSKVVQHFDAPPHPSTDLAFWYRYTHELNRTYLGSRAEAATQAVAPVPIDGRGAEEYPIFDRDRIEQHPEVVHRVGLLPKKPDSEFFLFVSHVAEDATASLGNRPGIGAARRTLLDRAA